MLVLRLLLVTHFSFVHIKWKDFIRIELLYRLIFFVSTYEWNYFIKINGEDHTCCSKLYQNILIFRFILHKLPKLAETKLSSSPYLGIPSYSMSSKKEFVMKHNLYLADSKIIFQKQNRRGNELRDDQLPFGVIFCWPRCYFPCLFAHNMMHWHFKNKKLIIWCIVEFLWCGRPKKNAYFGGKHMTPSFLMWTFSRSIIVICKANPSFVFMDLSLASFLEHSSIKAMD